MQRNVILFLISLQLTAFSAVQAQQMPQADSLSPVASFVKAWEADFLDEGIAMRNDSLHISEEAKRLLVDSVYRNGTYPAVYNWREAIQLLNKMELKKAFWHLINLYRTDAPHKELVLQTFVAYDSLVDMEKILTHTFYTFALTDPQICRFKNGKPVIERPDVLEEKLAVTKEIIAIVKYNRKPVAAK